MGACAGSDILNGGAGADTFRFEDYELVPTIGAPTTRVRPINTITDFEQNEDRIDFSGMDSNPAATGMQSFVFIGSDAFTANTAQVRFFYDDANERTVVQVTRADTAATDFMELHLSGFKTALSASDFILG